jgi:hypothetical protein
MKGATRALPNMPDNASWGQGLAQRRPGEEASPGVRRRSAGIVRRIQRDFRELAVPQVLKPIVGVAPGDHSGHDHVAFDFRAHACAASC